MVLVSSRDADADVAAAHPRVIVGLKCGVAVLRGAQVYAPGVLGVPEGTQSTNPKLLLMIEHQPMKTREKIAENIKPRFGHGKKHCDSTPLIKMEPEGIQSNGGPCNPSVDAGRCPHAGLSCGDRVSVFADIEGRCLRGWSRPFTYRAVFVGNGVLLRTRRDLFTVDEPK